MTGEVIAAFVGFIGVVTAAVIGWFSTSKEKHRRQQSEAEMSLQMAALDFSDFLSEWYDTHAAIEHMMEHTPIDRFLILRAWNGRLAPRWTTAIYQLRKGDQETFSYVHYELDQDYVDRLRHVSLGNEVRIKTEDLPDCGIRKLYENEGVTEAVWLLIEERWIPRTDARAITYCSFATHEETGISPYVATQCRILAGRLKGVAMAFCKGE